METKQIKKLKLKPQVKYTILILFSSLFCFSCYKIASYLVESKKTEEIIKEVVIDTKPVEIHGSEDAELINPPTEKESDYWSFIKTPYIDVDFNDLSNKNKDTVAWLYVKGTNVNYPVVQTNNNTYYLNHAFDKSWNSAGWLFMDYRNSSTDWGTNTIIYGHSMLNTTMFGSLNKTRKSAWYNDKSNWIIKLSTPTEYTLWQVVSLYTTEAESYYITTDFTSENDINKFLNDILSRSKFDFGTTLTHTDKLLTLSTCTSGYNNRYVVHAKLIKREIK